LSHELEVSYYFQEKNFHNNNNVVICLIKYTYIYIYIFFTFKGIVAVISSNDKKSRIMDLATTRFIETYEFDWAVNVYLTRICLSFEIMN